MKGFVKKLLIATSISVGMGGIFAAPALAGSLTVTNIGGSAADDYFVYDADSENTLRVDSTLQNAQSVLDGDALNPTGNVELRADSEQYDFDFTKNTTLEGIIGGQEITLSSLTEDDWLSTDASGERFFKRWFDDALIANGYGMLVNPQMYNDATFIEKMTASVNYQILEGMFLQGKGRERFSDPNISYVNQDDSNGLISIGLAGHFDARDLFMEYLGISDPAVFDSFRDEDKKGTAIQISEIVKVTYNDETDYLYSFNGTETGLVDKDDDISHNGNYEVQFQGIKPTPDFAKAAVPEPSFMLGLLSVAGVFVSKRKSKKG